MSTSPMAQLHVRNLDDWIVSAFRERARQNGRSLEAELRDILRTEALRTRQEIADELQSYLLDYLQAAGITEGPIFRSTIRKTKKLTANAMTAIDICRMMKRRLRNAALPIHFSPHSFRVAVITNLLEQNEALEAVQGLAGHADPRTTRLYDRRGRKVTRNLVDHIRI